MLYLKMILFSWMIFDLCINGTLVRVFFCNLLFLLNIIFVSLIHINACTCRSFLFPAVFILLSVDSWVVSGFLNGYKESYYEHLGIHVQEFL